MEWYAVYTKWHHEKKVAHYLKQKNIECYLPLFSSLRKWKDRRAWIDIPLFPCYLFVYCDISRDKRIINNIRGVISLVGTPFPESIPDYQISSLKTIIESGKVFQRVNEIMVGREVLVIKGPLKGVRGILVEKRNRGILVVQVELINQGIYILADKRELIYYDGRGPTPCSVINPSEREYWR